MEAIEYLKKREEICNEIMRSIGSCGLNACPLYYYDCGIPGNEEAMKRAIKFVEVEQRIGHTWKTKKALSELWEECMNIDDITEKKSLAELQL